MEPRFQSTFIPKGPIASAATTPHIERSHNILGLLARFVFVVAILLVLGVFGYKLYLTSRISTLGTDLEAAGSTLELETINDITDLNARLLATRELLQKHVVVSSFFDFLEANTLKTVRFSDLNFETKESGIAVHMRGTAHG